MVNKRKRSQTFGFTLTVIAVLFIAYGCGNEKPDWKTNPKGCFCGKEFKSSHNVAAIAMDVKSITVLNCDGTYTSKEDWGTSKEYEETYRNSAGSSSGSNGNFSGTWQIVNTVSTEDLSKFERPINDGSLEKFAIIKYTSNLGKTRYAIVCEIDGKISLSPQPYSTDVKDKEYDYKDLNMYDGMRYAE